jgi:hypothetical protein
MILPYMSEGGIYRALAFVFYIKWLFYPWPNYLQPFIYVREKWSFSPNPVFFFASDPLFLQWTCFLQIILCFLFTSLSSEVEFLTIKSIVEVEFLTTKSIGEVEFLTTKSIGEVEFLTMKSICEVEFLAKKNWSTTNISQQLDQKNCRYELKPKKSIDMHLQHKL